MNGSVSATPLGKRRFLENAVNHLSGEYAKYLQKLPRAGETVSVGDDFVRYLTELGIWHTWHQPVARGSPGPGGRDHRRRDRRSGSVS